VWYSGFLSAVWAEQEEGEFIRDMVDAVYRDYNRPFSDMIFPFYRWHEAPSREPVATDTGI
jgi:hypothetical protein